MNKIVTLCIAASLLSGTSSAEADTDSRVAKKPEKAFPAKESSLQGIDQGKKLMTGTIEVDLQTSVMTDSNGNQYPLVHPVEESERVQRERRNSGLSELELYATGYHPHGYVLEDAERFRGHDVSGLLRMMRDERYIDNWATIIALIGQLGDEAVIEQLRSYHEDDSDHSLEAVVAKLAAVRSLGVLASRHGADEILDYLASFLQIGKWEARNDFAAIKDQDFAAVGVRETLVGISYAGGEKAAALIRRFRDQLAKNPKLRSRMVRKDVTLSYMDHRIARAEIARDRDFLEAERRYRVAREDASD